MADKTTPFVINDRRKFTADGELRPDREPSPDTESPAAAAPEPEAQAPGRPPAETISFPSQPEAKPDTDNAPKHAHAEPIAFPGSAAPFAEPATGEEPAFDETQMPPAPTAEQLDQAARAYAATVDRLDTAMRATNPGMDRLPEMSFDRFVQSLYMQAILQLGGAAEPGQQPQVDILGARQTIDMLAVIAEKTNGNLAPAEDTLMQSALFEARMAFLEITQALARQAASRQGSSGMPGAPGGGPGMPGGPRVVR